MWCALMGLKAKCHTVEKVHQSYISTYMLMYFCFSTSSYCVPVYLSDVQYLFHWCVLHAQPVVHKHPVPCDWLYVDAGYAVLLSSPGTSKPLPLLLKTPAPLLLLLGGRLQEARPVPSPSPHPPASWGSHPAWIPQPCPGSHSYGCRLHWGCLRHHCCFCAQEAPSFTQMLGQLSAARPPDWLTGLPTELSWLRWVWTHSHVHSYTHPFTYKWEWWWKMYTRHILSLMSRHGGPWMSAIQQRERGH